MEKLGIPSVPGSPSSRLSYRWKSKKMRRATLAILISAVLLYYFWNISFQGRFCSSSVSTSRQTGRWQNIFCPSRAPHSDDWNLFYHLGGNGPWVPKVKGVVEGHHALPEGCEVDQVHMISRHAERYPTKNAGNRHLDILDRLAKTKTPATGPVSFLRDWSYFADVSGFEDLTFTGPYAGTLQATNTGLKLRRRYGHLVNRKGPTKFWTCTSPRDIETAIYFANGFFGTNWATDGSALLQKIKEDADQGANTLTPGDTCQNFIDDKEFGHDQGYGKLAEWQAIFSPPIAERLSPYIPGFTFKPIDVYGMMEMCGFEILARGASPWCEVFTEEEWIDFEYGRDLLHFYRAGPGNKYARAMGWLWLNATQELLTNNSAGGLYFSFVHDGDIIPLMATLGLLDESSAAGILTGQFHDRVDVLPTDQVKHDRHWKTSDIVPMGGRAIFERITCTKRGFAESSDETFVRLFINDGLIPIQDGSIKDEGLKNCMRLGKFQAMVQAMGYAYGDFRTVCGLNETAPSKISFLHQWS